MSLLESVIWKLGQKGYGEREKTKSKEQKQKAKTAWFMAWINGCHVIEVQGEQSRRSIV